MLRAFTSVRAAGCQSVENRHYASVSVPDTLAALNVNTEAGLTHAEADTCRKEHGNNEVAEQ